MKKIIFFGLSTFLLLTVFTSCKKDSKPLTTSEKIQHTWNVVSVEETSNTATTVVASNPNKDYMEFKSDMTVITYISGKSDISDYSIISDNLISIDGEQVAISNLSTTTLNLSEKEGTGSDEVTYNITLSKSN